MDGPNSSESSKASPIKSNADNALADPMPLLDGGDNVSLGAAHTDAPNVRSSSITVPPRVRVVLCDMNGLSLFGCPFIITTMSSTEDSFLFALDVGRTLTARKAHIRRLFDVMQLSIQRNDLSRAKRAWAILARCKEIDPLTMWPTALHLLDDNSGRRKAHLRELEFLRAMMLQHPNEVWRIRSLVLS
jgi:RNA polymerase I specific initiation factor